MLCVIMEQLFYYKDFLLCFSKYVADNVTNVVEN